MAPPPRILIIDNYDSYTFNLVHLVGAPDGAFPEVVLNDAIPITQILEGKYDALVISPGPGSPHQASDVGQLPMLFSELQKDPTRRLATLPILGICFGHQFLAALTGGKIIPHKTPTHGKGSLVYHQKQGLFRNLPSPFSCMRYHSLHIQTNTLSEDWKVSAYLEDGTIMGIEHAAYPHFGVQFHPESVWSEHGDALIRNFLSLLSCEKKLPIQNITLTPLPTVWMEPEELYPILSKRLLDSHPFSALIETQTLSTNEPAYPFVGYAKKKICGYCDRVEMIHAEGKKEIHWGNPFAYLCGIASTQKVSLPKACSYPFLGGLLGCFYYELGFLLHDKLAANLKKTDVLFELLWVEEGLIWNSSNQTIEAFYCEASSFLDVAIQVTKEFLPTKEKASCPAEETGFTSSRFQIPQETYLEKIKIAQTYIRAGESYELCLTNQVYAHALKPPFEVYKILRKKMNARYQAFYQLGEQAVVSCSPERFLYLTQEGRLETEPIKGTRPRGKSPEEDEKNRLDLATSEKDLAENRMIVDVSRHDLGKVCKLGSVQTTARTEVRTLNHLFQMFSCVQGQLLSDKNSVDALRALFPPASMTGAPKLRSMEYLYALEDGCLRGIYSGAQGYISFHGTADLAVTIRTLVFKTSNKHPSTYSVSIGSGGAIVLDSIPEEEWEEIQHKIRALF